MVIIENIWYLHPCAGSLSVLESLNLIYPGKENIRLTMSFGVADFSEDAASYTELVDKADKALYSAKQQGRNTVCHLTA